MGYAADVVALRELGDQQPSRIVHDGRLRPGASEGRSFVQEELQVLGRVRVRVYGIGGADQRGQPDQGRNTVAADIMGEGLRALAPVPEHPDARLIRYRQQIVDLRMVSLAGVSVSGAGAGPFWGVDPRRYPVPGHRSAGRRPGPDRRRALGVAPWKHGRDGKTGGPLRAREIRGERGIVGLRR